MKISVKSCTVVLFLIMIISACDLNEKNGENIQSTSEAFKISPDDLDSWIKRARDGDGDAAIKVGNYFAISRRNTTEAITYFRYSALDGNESGMWSLAIFLSALGGE